MGNVRMGQRRSRGKIQYTNLMLFFLSFIVRLHDSISEEGFHYLVFDL